MSITIHNQSRAFDGICDYDVKIQDKVICSFEHNPKDGLAICLTHALNAVTKHNKEQGLLKHSP